jgi:hypothetical protein
VNKSPLSICVIIATLLILFFSSVNAQTYKFQVPREEVIVVINADGTISIEYDIAFTNQPGAHEIDFVDIGVPNSSYRLNNITANVNGKTITDIQSSEFVTPGIALGLGSNSIPAGQSGTVHLKLDGISKILFPGTEKESEAYASFQFSPNWFDSQYVSGSTDMTVMLVLPPGLKPEEPRFYPPKNWLGEAGPETGLDSQGKVYYRWQATNANTFTQYIFGCAFPSRLVSSSAITTPPQKSINLGITQDNFCCIGFGLFFAAIFGLSIYSSTIGARKRKLQYLPPKISIEGHGIKRGLTAVEAAILMEEPMDKIMTMILFSLLKKGGARVIQRDPLKIQANNPLPEGLQTYEIAFINAFQESDGISRRKALQTMVIDLVNSVSEKMKGFSRKETVAYYKDIINRAWQQVEAADTPEVKSQKYDEYIGWTMLDGDYDGRTRRVFTGPVFLPNWWWRFDPTYSSPSLSGGGIGSSVSGGGGQSTSSFSLPNLPGSSFAASVVSGVQSFGSNVLGNITDFTSGVTNKTNPVPVTRSSSGSRGGGGGCACACACAGCACACAGGGR